MTKMPGKSVLDIWFEEPWRNVEKKDRVLRSQHPSDAEEEKRITFMRSLAKAMTQLEQLKNNEIGVPTYFGRGYVVEEYWGCAAPLRWYTITRVFEPYTIGPFTTSKDFYQYALDKTVDPKNVLDKCGPESKEYYIAVGARIILDIMVASLPLSIDAKAKDPQAETFAIRHNDLDMQNILVDDEGNVTGIIDWDGLMTVPECLGPTANPFFLRRDMLPKFSFSIAPFAYLALPKYREVYADEMSKHTDARYTLKSTWYQAVYAVLYEDADPYQVVEMVLKEIPEFKFMPTALLYTQLAKGWPIVESLLREKISQMFMADD
jgi:hypothetical protein